MLGVPQLLAVIGEQFDGDASNEICGVVINIRNKQDRLSIWTKTASNESAQVRSSRQKRSPRAQRQLANQGTVVRPTYTGAGSTCE